MKLRRKSGFTLIEMLVVIAIIGILATISFVFYAGAKAKSNYSKTYTDLSSISKAASMYSAQYSNYPSETWNGEVDDPAFKKFLPTWPKNTCTDYVYHYHNDTYGTGVYLKYIMSPVNLFYQNINRLNVCQYGSTNPSSQICLNAPMGFISPVKNLQDLIDKTYAAPPQSYKLPLNIADVPDKSFSCGDYKTYLP